MVCPCWATLFVGAIVGYYVLRFLWELIPQGGLSSKAVFISGCDSGFGRLLAVKCANAGITVFAGCLTEKEKHLFYHRTFILIKGELAGTGAATLKSEANSPHLLTVKLDVTSDESVNAARDHVVRNMPNGVSLWGVVNNAGVFSCYGPDDWLSLDDYKQSVDVNTYGVIRITQAFKKLVKASRGRIVTVTSVNGRLSSPAAGPYVVAKFAAEAYMDAIRQELRNFGVKCSILEPGIFRTPLLDEQAMIDRVEKVWGKLDKETKEEYGEKFKNYFAQLWNKTYISMSSSNLNLVVDNYFHALTAKFPRDRYYCGWDAIFVFVPLSLMPTWITDNIVRVIGKQEVLPACMEKKKTN